MKTSNLLNARKITKGFILASALASFTSFAQVNVISNGNVGIGTGTSLTPQTKFDVLYTGNAFGSGAIYGGHFVNSNTNSSSTNPYTYGLYGSANATESNGAAYHYGIASNASGAWQNVGISAVAVGTTGNGARNYGGYFNASSQQAANGIAYGCFSTVSGSQNNYGLYVSSTYANTNTGSVNYGVYATASGALTNYAGYFNGDVYVNGGSHSGTGYLVTSDKKFKTQIKAISSPSDILKQLAPKTYYFDTTSNNGMHFSGKKQYGFIAQDVQLVLPELVFTVVKPATLDSVGKVIQPAVPHLAINYDGFIPVLTAALQAQQNKIDSLVNKTTNQDSINKSLQDQINQIVTNCCHSSVGSNNTQGTTNSTLATGISGSNGTNTNAILYQNMPNPFSQTTVVKCLIPQNCQAASLLVFDMNGSLKKTIAINGKGEVNTTINGNQLVSGMYYYTLLIDGQEIDTKKMILTE